MKKIFGLATLFFVLFFGLAITVHARNVAAGGEDFVLEAGETSKDDLFAVGRSVTIDGNVNGDLYAAGGNVFINGDVTGDVLAAGGDVIIKGVVGGDVRVAGGNLTIAGDVIHNVTVAGGNVVIDKDGAIEGNVTAFSGNLTIDGLVGGNLKTSAGRLMINSKIGGNIEALVDELGLGPTATVSGNLRYVSQNPATIERGATISGTVAHDVPVAAKPLFELSFKTILLFKLVLFLPIFALGILIIRVAPKSSQILADQVSNHYIRNFFVGLALWVLGWILAIVLMATVIGIPLSLFLIFALFAYLYLSFIPTGLAMGRKFVKDSSGPIQLAVGLGLIFAVSFVPVAGKLLLFVLVFVGFASIIIGKYSVAKALRAKKVL